jgi:hypothetical protein
VGVVVIHLHKITKNYCALLINTNWITEVWEYLHTCKAAVEVDGLWQPEATVIMETLIASGIFTNKELKNINYCRIYLQAFFISDIMNLEGDNIKEWAGRGHGSGLFNNGQSRGRHVKLRYNILHQMDTQGMHWVTGDLGIIRSWSGISMHTHAHDIVT